MTSKLIFAIEQYSMLLIFMVAVYGLGRLPTAWIATFRSLPLDLRVPLRMAAGIAVLMVLLFAAASLHQLSGPVVTFLIMTGIALAVLPGQWLKQWRRLTQPKARFQYSIAMSLWALVLAAVILPLMLEPLRPPHDWDELMYHLPYARFWAEQGGLDVNEWLRFPVFPYSMELLYAGALLVGSDVLPHLLHAFTAALTTMTLFAFARRYFDWKVACMSALLLLLATSWGWKSANAEFGAMLFWTVAFVALALANELRDRRFLYLAMVFAGTAVGIKYQALLLLPVFGVCVLLLERRPGTLVTAGLLFLLFGGFWYLRNYLIAGNPIHPVAQNWLGFWLWDAADLKFLQQDLQRIRGWPNWYLLLFIGSALFWRGSTQIQRAILLITTTVVGIWWVVSGVARYLTPAFPMMAILSASFLIEVAHRLGASGKFAAWSARAGHWSRLTVSALFCLVIVGSSITYSHKIWTRKIPEESERRAFLIRKFGGYELMSSLPDRGSGTIYQLGFEDEIYLLGPDVRGDWFGPGRYRDVLSLTEDAEGLARHLAAIGADGLLINRVREPFSSQVWDPALSTHFHLVRQTDRAVLYWKRNPVYAVNPYRPD